MAMKLIFDNYNQTWYWVMPEKPDYPMSPEFDDETGALLWRGHIAKENFYDWAETQKELTDLKEGATVLIPKNKEHAENMLRVASFYLENTNGTKSN